MLVFVNWAGFERILLELGVPVTMVGEAAPEQVMSIPHFVATAEKYHCHFLPPAS